MSGFIAFVAAVAAAIYTNIAGSASTSLIGGGSCSVTLTVRRDGTWQLTNVSGTPTLSPSGSQTWLTPNNAGSGDARWVRVTNAGPDAPTGTLATWLALTADRAWVLTAPPATTVNCTLTVAIATDSGGSNIVSSGSVTLHADND
ncbi:MAG: hypothetical protein ABI433_01005 [Burkholderiaceae bacterium]